MRIKVKYDLESDGKIFTMKEIGLTSIIEIPDDTEEHEISDYISDKTGWCVFSWKKFKD